MPGTVLEKPVGTRLALITTLGSDGEIWFALTHANTDSDVMLLYLSRLSFHLDKEL